MRKFEYKYKIDEEHKTIVAFSSFAGRTVTGVARCANEDIFDIETGKKLAAARCNLKIAEKRMKYAEECLLAAASEAEYWVNYQSKMEKYESDSVNAYRKALLELTDLEKTFE